MGKISFHQKTKTAGMYGRWLFLFAIGVFSLFNTARAESKGWMVESPSLPIVRLHSANSLAIEFQSQNGQIVHGQDPDSKEIPHLVLFRNSSLTNKKERTLHLSLSGLEVSLPWMKVEIKVESQQGDPDRGGDDKYRIPVWEHSEWIPNPHLVENMTLSFEKEFLATTSVEGEMVMTPTDYFRIEIAIYADSRVAGDLTRDLDGNPIYTFTEEYAFLMESQWVAPLSRLDPIPPFAGPAELAIYYSDMFPFQKNLYGPNNRLSRAEVHNYIREELVPALLEAEWIQTNEWGFLWQENWTGFRSGAYRDRLNVTLVHGDLWFHGRAPGQADSGISINLDWPKRSAYDSLTDWITTVYHHELFHNLQRNQKLANGKWSDIDGKHDVWRFITEGTAVLASSVGQPDVEFAQSRERRTYLTNANRFLAGDRYFNNDLKTSYTEINPYNTTLYWRLLYEQCSGPAGATGDFNSGMEIIRHTLNTLYASDDLEGITKEELVQSIPTLMNQVFSIATLCPFQTYEESLVQFSRAIYALRLEGGRCEQVGSQDGCSFYDPNGVYAKPRVAEIIYLGDRQQYETSIASSFGMAFVEITLKPQVNGESLSLVFEPAEGGEAEFSVQVWKLEKDREGRIARIPNQMNSPDVLAYGRAIGATVYEIDRIDLEQYNRLGLIITRLDSHEGLDGVGAFTISLCSDLYMPCFD